MWTIYWATLGREHGQEMNRNYYPPLFSASESTPGITCLVLGSPVLEGYQEIGEGLADGWWDGKWPTAHDLWRYVGEVGLGSLAKKKLRGDPVTIYSYLKETGKDHWANGKTRSKGHKLRHWSCDWVHVIVHGWCRTGTYCSERPRSVYPWRLSRAG